MSKRKSVIAKAQKRRKRNRQGYALKKGWIRNTRREEETGEEVRPFFVNLEELLLRGKIMLMFILGLIIGGKYRFFHYGNSDNQ